MFHIFESTPLSRDLNNKLKVWLINRDALFEGKYTRTNVWLRATLVQET